MPKGTNCVSDAVWERGSGTPDRFLRRPIKASGFALLSGVARDGRVNARVLNLVVNRRNPKRPAGQFMPGRPFWLFFISGLPGDTAFGEPNEVGLLHVSIGGSRPVGRSGVAHKPGQGGVGLHQQLRALKHPQHHGPRGAARSCTSICTKVGSGSSTVE